jgi:hypothetical protein
VRVVILPEPVRRVTAHYLSLADARLPGVVEGLYLGGSLGFGEWYDGRSDVDFIAVTRTRPDAPTVAQLHAIHDEVGAAFPRPFLSGSYVTWADLARSPAEAPEVPGILEGTWRDVGPAPSPVEWHELAHHQVLVRGPDPHDVEIHADVAELRGYSQRNLTEYWEPNLRRLSEHREAAGRPDLVEWFVLGIPRLHHAIATGTLTSKDGAGHYALEVFGRRRWRPVVAEALTHRTRGEPSGVWDGRQSQLVDEVLAFCELALEAGLALDPTDESASLGQS